MVFNRFNIIVLLLSVLIAIIGIALVEVWIHAEYKVAKLTISILWAGSIITLIKYVNKTNRSLKQFLESLRYSDYVNADKSGGRSFKELNLSFNEIIRYVRLAELEKESTHIYLRQVLDQMPSGIIACDQKGTVEIINRAGLKILGIQSLSNLSHLNNLQKALGDEIIKIAGSNKRVISLQTKNEFKSILFRLKKIKINIRTIQVISFENIRTELDVEEEKAWQKIFRVLTHEIMNSIAPIRSLTASVMKIFLNNQETKTISELNEKDINAAVKGLKSIDNRNKGLSSFVSDFKKVMRIPEPQTMQFEVNQLLKEVHPFLKEFCAPKKIKLNIKFTKKNCFLLIDQEQITQVLINLVKNATEAISAEKGVIEILVEEDENNIKLNISDNGDGISKEILPEIFIPFFTTKKEGSGIGLSISRQILRNHGGNLKITSEENYGTTCELTLPIA